MALDHSLSLCLAGLGLLYVVLYRRFRAYEIDNPWYLSFSRSFWVDHVGSDVFLKGVFPDGMGGTAVFGRLPALVQGAVLNRFGWQPDAALLLSTAVVLAGLAVWYGFLRRSGLSVERSSACVLALGLLEPFVDMAERFRYEPCGFLLLAGAFWLASAERPWMALTVGLLALETEPAAGLVFASVGLFLVRSGWRARTMMAGAALAAGVFAVVYGGLHPGIVGILRATDWHRGAVQRELGGFLRAYFVDRQRHLVELLLLAGCAAVVARRYKEAPTLVRRMTEVVLLVTACSFAMNWPTPAYMVFWYPAVLVVVGWAVARMGWTPWVLPAVVGLMMLPQYGALAWINRGEGFRPEDFDKVRTALREAEARAGIDDAGVRVMGEYSLWFAHPAGYEALARTTLEDTGSVDVFLCSEYPLRPWPMFDPIGRYCASVPKTAVEVKRLMVRGHLMRIMIPAARLGPGR